MKPKLFKGIAVDYINGTNYEYPKLPENIEKVRLPIDLILTKNKTWFYMWSHTQVKGILEEDAKKEILQRKEKYKILDSITGKILEESK